MSINTIPLRIATRRSRLAMWQAEYIAARVAAVPGVGAVSIIGLSTRGDEILDQPLAKIGGKGLFIKELEHALAHDQADIAVHSMKDVPAVMPDGFRLGAILAREDARDALVSNLYDTLEALPRGACVGTSSMRRAAQLRARFPTLRIKSLRGNLDTRLAKLDQGQFDAIILAAAGLRRLGYSARIRGEIPVDLSIPAIGQGALGIEQLTRRDELATLIDQLNDSDTSCCVAAERECGALLDASCETPLGVHARLRGDRLHICGFIGLPDGTRMVQADIEGPRGDASLLARELAAQLRARGANEILQLLGRAP